MANAIVDHLGQINQSGELDALFRDIFAGEILTAFARNNVMMDKHMVRTITHGKSASFPVVGGIGARYHVPGEEILGQRVNRNQRVITIDELLISDVFIADIEEAKNHYDVRSIYSTEMGRKLANVFDKNVIIELIKAARAEAVIPDGHSGTRLKEDKMKIEASLGAADVKEKASAIAAMLFKAAAILDEKDIPEEDRYAVFRPSDYYALVQNTDVINRDWGGAGIYSDGKVWRVAGIEILKSNNLVKTDTTQETDPDHNEFHSVDASQTVGLVWHKNAVGTVKLMDLSLQSAWDIRRQGTLIVARYAVGHGLLRPECAVELALDTLTN